jgi:nucleotide-binding universal stress UspA family protein
VEEGVPLRAGVDAGSRVIPFLEEARDVVQGAGVPVRSIVKVSHRISEGILDTAIDEGANFVILGRTQHPMFLDRISASVVDTLLDAAPCEVAILHGEMDPGAVRNVLIPFGENIHTRLAFEIAPLIVDHFKCKAEVVVVFEPGTALERQDEYVKRINDRMKASGLSANVKIARTKSVLQGITQRSKNADLIIMGGRSGGFLGLLLGQSLTQEITEQAACPVLWVNEYEEHPSFWKTLFGPIEKEVERHHG